MGRISVVLEISPLLLSPPSLTFIALKKCSAFPLGFPAAREILFVEWGFRDHPRRNARRPPPLNPSSLSPFPPTKIGFLFAITSAERKIRRSLTAANGLGGL